MPLPVIALPLSMFAIGRIEFVVIGLIATLSAVGRRHDGFRLLKHPRPNRR